MSIYSEHSSSATVHTQVPIKPLAVCLGDLLLLGLSYATMTMLFSTQSMAAGPQLKLGAVYGLVWLASVVLTRKCSRVFELPVRAALAKLVWAASLMALSVSILLVVFRLTGFSPAHLFGTMGLYVLLELVGYGAWSIRLKKLGLQQTGEGGKTGSWAAPILPLAGLDLMLLLGAYLGIYFLKRGTLDMTSNYWALMQTMIAAWAVASWLTRKFSKPVLPNYLNAMEACFKSAFIMAGLMAALVFGMQLFAFSRTQIFGTILLVLALEPIIYGLYFAFRAAKKRGSDVESAAEVRAMMSQENYDLPLNCPGQGEVPGKPVRETLKAGLELIQPWLFDFIDSNLSLKSVYKDRSLIVSTDDHRSLQSVAGDHGLSLLLNLHRTNDQRYLNRYFLEVHRLMKKGGYFVGKVQTHRNIRGRFKRRHSRNLAFALSLLHFLLHRVLPKLPVTKQVYFALTKGRNRVVSKAEVLGRLSFCGFEIIKAEDFDDHLNFIVRKTKQPSTVTDPTYGPLITLKRTGSRGQPILVYKFRTMHPYSEFLQDYIYSLNQLSPGGKIADDFRVTEYGRIMRKLWLDELPMLYNWMRGDLQLIGVRPLSRHFFSLYPQHVQELRQETKPGLLPPFYADMPKTLEDICCSEEKYLKSYLQAPMKTQIKYLVLSMYNIVIRGARSQ
ncbi:MAG: sugar transferase [Desulfovermiculus sp.]